MDAHTRTLRDGRALGQLTPPGGPGPTSRPEAKVPCEGMVGVVREMRPLAPGRRGRPGLQQQHVQAAGGQLFGHDGAALLLR